MGPPRPPGPATGSDCCSPTTLYTRSPEGFDSIRFESSIEQGQGEPVWNVRVDPDFSCRVQRKIPIRLYSTRLVLLVLVVPTGAQRYALARLACTRLSLNEHKSLPDVVRPRASKPPTNRRRKRQGSCRAQNKQPSLASRLLIDTRQVAQLKFLLLLRGGWVVRHSWLLGYAQ